VHLAPFLLKSMDIWHAQGIWVQGFILASLAGTFFETGKPILVKNKPLGYLFLWLTANVGFICYLGQVKHQYDVAHFLPYFNFLCMILLYRLFVQYLNTRSILRLLEYMRLAVIGVLLLCVLQSFELAQFFRQLYEEHAVYAKFLNNPVVGTVGNPTHLSAYLACCIPLFLLNRTRENYLALILLWIILLAKTGTTLGEPAMTGIISGICILAYYVFNENRKLFKILFCVGILAAISIVFLPREYVLMMLKDNGRLDWWGMYWPVFTGYPVTGIGLGGVKVVSQFTKLPELQHLHFELYHYAVETGLVGVVLILHLIKDFFKKNTDRLHTVLRSIFLGFVVSCFFNYSSHLWIFTVYLTFVYSSVYAIKNEVLHDINQRRN